MFFYPNKNPKLLLSLNRTCLIEQNEKSSPEQVNRALEKCIQACDQKLVMEAENMVVLERLDKEWVELIRVAKQMGMTKQEVSTYIKKHTPSKQ